AAQASAAEEFRSALAIPPLEAREVPIRCFRCQGEYAVPFVSYRAGTVFRCPHCLGSFVTTLSMLRAVAEALGRLHESWSGAFECVRDKRQRELAQCEERQRQEVARFEQQLRTVATRERAPGAPTKRRGFFSF